MSRQGLLPGFNSLSVRLDKASCPVSEAEVAEKRADKAAVEFENDMIAGKISDPRFVSFSSTPDHGVICDTNHIILHNLAEVLCDSGEISKSSIKSVQAEVVVELEKAFQTANYPVPHDVVG